VKVHRPGYAWAVFCVVAAGRTRSEAKVPLSRKRGETGSVRRLKRVVPGESAMRGWADETGSAEVDRSCGTTPH